MSVFNRIKNRGGNTQVAEHAFASSNDAETKQETDVGVDSSSDTLSLEERNEKEIQAHPDSITSDAQLGVKKAEATALVWSKKAVYLTYAW